MHRVGVVLGIVIFLLAPPALFAQSPASTDELRRELDAARAELAAVRARLESLEEKLQGMSGPRTSPMAAAAAPAQNPLRQETAKPAQRLSVRLGSAARATFYGQIYTNLFFNSSPVNFNDIPMFTVRGGELPGRGSLGLAARQTRFGLRLDEMKVGSAKATAVVEADFYGGFPNVGTGENFALPRLRLANLRLDGARTSLVVGQDWVIFAPLNPQSIAAAAVPELATAGNLWQRMAQLRLERLEEFAGNKFLLQAAVVVPATGDFPGSTYVFALQPSSGSRSEMPFWQGRVAFTPKRWFVKDRATWGLSAQYGQARGIGNRGEARVTSAGLAADWVMPLGAGFVFSGEGFFGRNLAAFQGGAFQGANLNFARRLGASLVPAGARAIGTRGGWAQLSFTPTSWRALTLNGAFGVDDLRDSDLLTVNRADLRTRNQAYFFNFIYKSSPFLSWGLEYRRTNTTQLVGRTLSNDHINLGFLLSF